MIQLPYGLRDGQLVHIDAAAPGRRCGCVCPECRQPLVAKKGTKIRHHFAHDHNADCPGALESALHLAAKEILTVHRCLRLPAVTLNFPSLKAPWRLFPARWVRFDAVMSERKTGGVRPDLIGLAGERILLIEIAVTHPAGPEKRERIRQLGLSALEISLAHLASEKLVPQSLAREIIGRLANRQWLYNHKAEQTRQHLQDLATWKPVLQLNRRLAVPDCPLRRRHSQMALADVSRDCLFCEYCLDNGLDSGAQRVGCLGESGIREYEDLVLSG